MKILTKEQEAEHYRETLKGGVLGGGAGLGLGLAAVYLASQRYQFMRQLTLPLKAFLVTSAGTFSGIVSADHWSRAYEQARNPLDKQYKEREAERSAAETQGMTFTQRAMDFGKKERYKIVAGSWVASMFAAFAIVNRDKYLTGSQKLVQARVYAQFLTLGVLVASAAFEIADSKNEEGRWETVRYVDPKDPEHKRMLEKRVEKEPGPSGGGEKEDRGGQDLWKDMVAAEEERIKHKEEDEKHWRKDSDAKHKKDGKGKKPEHKEEKKEGGDKKQEGGEKKEDKKDEGKKDSGEKEDDKKK